MGERIQRVEEVNAVREDFLGYLEADRFAHALARYDLTALADRVRCYAASDDEGFRGYLLTWQGREHPGVLLRGTQAAAEALVSRAPPGHATFLVEPGLEPAVETRREVTGRVPMDFMVVDRDRFPDRPVREARRLTRSDGPLLEALYAEIDRARDRDWGAWAAQGITYGVLRRNRLVSVAGTHFVGRDLCLVGGVYTARAFRRRGFAAETVAAVTRDALERGRRVALLVVSANEAAVGLYRALGYERVARWTWLGVGAVRPPLG